MHPVGVPGIGQQMQEGPEKTERTQLGPGQLVPLTKRQTQDSEPEQALKRCEQNGMREAPVVEKKGDAVTAMQGSEQHIEVRQIICHGGGHPKRNPGFPPPRGSKHFGSGDSEQCMSDIVHCRSKIAALISLCQS